MTTEKVSEKNYKFPKCNYYILCNEFLEKFSHYGLRTILVLFCTYFIQYDKTTSVQIYHSFVSLYSFMTVIGGVIADGYLGKYKTILYSSIVGVIGFMILSFSAINYEAIDATAEQIANNASQLATGSENAASSQNFKNFNSTLLLASLFIIALGTGSRKPCMTSFGADQFDPNDTQNRSAFFSYFYWALNLGSAVACYAAPFLRSVNCGNLFGDGNSCYFLALFTPMIFMLLSILVFLLGRSQYYKTKPSGNNILWECLKAIFYGAIRKIPANSPNQENWLYGAYGKVESWVIQDSKYLVKIIIMFLPLSIFWAALDQSLSKWILQAVNLNGYCFGNKLQFIPDQVAILNPLFVLVFIPAMNPFYNFCEKFLGQGFLTPLKKCSIGLFLSASSFIICGILQNFIEQDALPVNHASNQISLNFINLRASALENLALEPGLKSKSQIYDLDPVNSIQPISEYAAYEFESQDEGNMYTVVDFGLDDSTLFQQRQNKNENGLSRINLATNLINADFEFVCQSSTCQDYEIIIENCQKAFRKNCLKTDLDFKMGKYVLKINGRTNSEFEIGTGGGYTLIFTYHNQLSVHTDIRPNTISMLWILPQYFIVTISELMVSITGLEFAYTQAPPSLKSVITSFWLMTVSVGNMFIVLFDLVNVSKTVAGSFYWNF